MKDEFKNVEKKSDEPLADMIEEISNTIRKMERQNTVLRKIVLEINQKIKKKPL